MNPLYITFHEEGVALVEDTPTEHCLEINLPEEEMNTLQSLCQMESYRVAKALGSLVMFAISQDHTASQFLKLTA